MTTSKEELAAKPFDMSAVCEASEKALKDFECNIVTSSFDLHARVCSVRREVGDTKELNRYRNLKAHTKIGEVCVAYNKDTKRFGVSYWLCSPADFPNMDKASNADYSAEAKRCAMWNTTLPSNTNWSSYMHARLLPQIATRTVWIGENLCDVDMSTVITTMYIMPGLEAEYIAGINKCRIELDPTEIKS